MELSQNDIDKLNQAVFQAFPTVESLEQLVAKTWGIGTQDITVPVPRPNLIQKIIQYANAKDQIEDLINAARVLNPTSRSLDRVGAKIIEKLARTSRWPSPPTPYEVCFVEEELPFLNRTILRDFFRSVKNAGVPTVCVVNGPSACGKSYSAYLASYLRVAGQIDVVSIDLKKDVPAPAQYSPKQLTLDIARGAKWSAAPPDQASAAARYGEELVQWLMGQARESGSTLAIVLDNFNDPNLHTDSRELIKEMIKQFAAQYSTGQPAPVRLLLLNYPQELEPLIQSPIERDLPTTLTVTHINKFFADLIAHIGKPPPPGGVAPIANGVWNEAQNNGCNNVAIHKAVLEMSRWLRGLTE